MSFAFDGLIWMSFILVSQWTLWYQCCEVGVKQLLFNT